MEFQRSYPSTPDVGKFAIVDQYFAFSETVQDKEIVTGRLTGSRMLTFANFIIIIIIITKFV